MRDAEETASTIAAAMASTDRTGTLDHDLNKAPIRRMNPQEINLVKCGGFFFFF